MLLADRDKLWPQLEELGEKKVREMLTANQFKAHEEEEVQEWLTRQAAVSAIKDVKITKWAAIVVAVATVVSAVVGVCGLLK